MINSLLEKEIFGKNLNLNFDIKEVEVEIEWDQKRTIYCTGDDFYFKLNIRFSCTSICLYKDREIKYYIILNKKLDFYMYADIDINKIIDFFKDVECVEVIDVKRKVWVNNLYRYIGVEPRNKPDLFKRFMQYKIKNKIK